MKTFSHFLRGTALVLALPLAALAQSGVGIGTTAPDASAALDIVSSTKGALLPRLTSAQRTAIATPATGLLVFQTDGTAGFYYNAGPPAVPAWTLLSAAATGDNLGNHTATQALNLGPNPLVGNGGTAGLTVGSAGDVAVAGTVQVPAAKAYTYATPKTYTITYGPDDFQPATAASLNGKLVDTGGGVSEYHVRQWGQWFPARPAAPAAGGRGYQRGAVLH